MNNFDKCIIVWAYDDKYSGQIDILDDILWVPVGLTTFDQNHTIRNFLEACSIVGDVFFEDVMNDIEERFYTMLMGMYVYIQEGKNAKIRLVNYGIDYNNVDAFIKDFKIEVKALSGGFNRIYIGTYYNYIEVRQQEPKQFVYSYDYGYKFLAIKGEYSDIISKFLKMYL